MSNYEDCKQFTHGGRIRLIPGGKHGRLRLQPTVGTIFVSLVVDRGWMVHRHSGYWNTRRALLQNASR
jgi:hypothetical protein